MQRIQATFRRLRDARWPDWGFLLLLLALCFYCFGVLLSRLGYFQDDWHHVFQAYWYGPEGLRRFLLTDRGPFSYLVYVPFFKVLGFVPARWHWSLMVLRFLTAAAFWFSMRQVWPRQAELAGWLALLFLVYPIFTLQPLAVAYTLHWSMYLVFMLSLALMLYAARQGRGWVWLTVLALALEGMHLVCIEYFAGLELTRPVFLWLLYAGLPRRDRWTKTLRTALPYLVLVLLYSVYRSAYASVYGFDRFQALHALTAYIQAPLAGLERLAQYMLQDFVFITLSPWHSAIDPAVIDLSRSSTYLIFGSMIAFAIGAYLLMSRLKPAPVDAGSAPRGRDIAAAGVLVVVLSMLPFWTTGFSIFQKNQLWSDRLALAAMPGAALLVAGLVYALAESGHSRRLVLSALLGLAISQPVQTARSYEDSWRKQLDLYWQLHWRVPSLRTNTMLVSDQEILFFMGIYPTAFALNVLYPQKQAWPQASYWFDAGMEHIRWDAFSAGEPTVLQKYTEVFQASRDGVLAITFEPRQGQCLRVLRPEYADLPELSDTAKTWLSVSDPGRIQATPVVVPPPAIFGREPAHGWCYYYESADLARQFGEWQKVLELWRQSQQAGVRSENSIELMPFIEALARTGQWDQARSLTKQAGRLPDRSASALCRLWDELGSSTAPSPQRDAALARASADLTCP